MPTPVRRMVIFLLLLIEPALYSSFSNVQSRISTQRSFRRQSSSSPTISESGGDQLVGYYQRSTGLSLTIIAVELLSSLQNRSPSPFLGSILPAYSAALFSTKVLGDAAGRNRLDATTFKLLNFGIVLDAVQTVSSTIPIAFAIARSSSLLKSLFGLLCLCHAYLTASTSYSALTSFGVPKIKIAVNGPLSASYMFLAASNFFLPPQIYSCSFLITAIFLALSGASVAGQKRLSSTTYKSLNCAIVVNSLFKMFGLASQWPAQMSGKMLFHTLFVYFFPFLTLSTALAGYITGSLYKE